MKKIKLYFWITLLSVLFLASLLLRARQAIVKNSPALPTLIPVATVPPTITVAPTPTTIAFKEEVKLIEDIEVDLEQYPEGYYLQVQSGDGMIMIGNTVYTHDQSYDDRRYLGVDFSIYTGEGHSAEFEPRVTLFSGDWDVQIIPLDLEQEARSQEGEFGAWRSEGAEFFRVDGISQVEIVGTMPTQVQQGIMDIRAFAYIQEPQGCSVLENSNIIENIFQVHAIVVKFCTNIFDIVFS
jgi:hypothetical protein